MKPPPFIEMTARSARSITQVRGVISGRHSPSSYHYLFCTLSASDPSRLTLPALSLGSAVRPHSASIFALCAVLAARIPFPNCDSQIEMILLCVTHGAPLVSLG